MSTSWKYTELVQISKFYAFWMIARQDYFPFNAQLIKVKVWISGFLLWCLESHTLATTGYACRDFPIKAQLKVYYGSR